MRFYFILLLFIVCSFSYGQHQVPGFAYVKFSNSSDARLRQNSFQDEDYYFRKIINNASTARKQHSELDRVYEVSFDKNLNFTEFKENINKRYSIDYVEPVYVYEQFEDEPTDPGVSNQYYHELVETFQAWKFSKGENVVVAIIDSGVELDHEDLKNNIFINENDPINGIDDDNDGYIDNYFGWDFVGFSIDELLNSNDFQGDNDPNATLSDHGTHVAGIVAAEADNSLGISGIAPQSKLMILKCGEDKGDYPRAIFRGYEAIIYAAEKGADIINCSWGGRNFSQFGSEVVEYANSLGSIIIASAGNSGRDENNYPASFPGVISVANTNQVDLKNSSSTFHSSVDISAPGTDIYSTTFNNTYSNKTGTSMASPIVAGVAALLKKSRPQATSNEIKSLLINSVDDIYSKNNDFLGKLGNGRINALKPFLNNTPAFNLDLRFQSDDGRFINAGQNFTLEGQILNFLSSVNDVKVTITSRNPNVTLQNNQFEVESFQSGNALDLGSMGIVGNVSSGAPDNLDVLFDVEFSNSDFKRTYFITNLFNSTIYSFSENNITSTISGNGRIGFNNPNNASKIGNGVIFDDINYLLAHGITIVQKNTDRFLDNTFNDRFSINSDFNISKRFTNKANKRAQNEINGMFADSFVEATRKLGLNIEYNLLINSTVEDENYFIYELILENTSGEDRDSLYLGHFFNLQNLPDNEIDLNWNDGNSVIASMENKNAFLAFTLLNKDAAASFFNREDFDFSYESKRNILLSDEIEENSLSNSFYIKSQVFSLDAGKKDTIAIAIHAAFTLDEIYESIENSLFYYNQKLKVPQFEDNIITICGSNNLIIPNYNQGQLRWYRNYTDVDPFFTGTGLQINGVKRNTLLYVSRVINGRESIKKEVKLEVSPQTSLNNSGSVKICEGDSLLLELPDQSAKYLWNDGVTTNRSKYVNKPGEYFAFISNDNGCENYSDTLVLSIHPPPPSLQMSEINQRDICLQNELIVDFSNQLNSKESVLAQIADTFFINGISLPITINNPNTDIKFFRINEFGCKSEFASPEFVVKGEIPLISYDDGQLKTNIENADLYEWYLDNQLVGTGQFFTPLSLGTYFVEVSKSGCINRSEDYEVLITSIVQDDEYSKHLIYPNPTNKYVSILLKNKSLSEIVDVYILDVLGNKLLPRLKSTSENIIELDVSNLSTGVYNVVLQEKNGSIVIRKFQKN